MYYRITIERRWMVEQAPVLEVYAISRRRSSLSWPDPESQTRLPSTLNSSAQVLHRSHVTTLATSTTNFMRASCLTTCLILFVCILCHSMSELASQNSLPLDCSILSQTYSSSVRPCLPPVAPIPVSDSLPLKPASAMWLKGQPVCRRGHAAHIWGLANL